MPDAALDATPDAIPAHDFVAMFFAVWDELLGGDEAYDAAHAERVTALVRGNPKWQPDHVRGGLVNLAHGAQA